MGNRHEFENSSAIAHCDFDDEAGCLEIGFKTGTVHRFPEATKDLYEGLKSAESPGAFFHKHLRKMKSNKV